MRGRAASSVAPAPFLLLLLLLLLLDATGSEANGVVWLRTHLSTLEPRTVAGVRQLVAVPGMPATRRFPIPAGVLLPAQPGWFRTHFNALRRLRADLALRGAPRGCNGVNVPCWATSCGLGACTTPGRTHFSGREVLQPLLCSSRVLLGAAGCAAVGLVHKLRVTGAGWREPAAGAAEGLGRCARQGRGQFD